MNPQNIFAARTGVMGQPAPQVMPGQMPNFQLNQGPPSLMANQQPGMQPGISVGAMPQAVAPTQTAAAPGLMGARVGRPTFQPQLPQPQMNALAGRTFGGGGMMR
jgi:hypothetical protein